MRRFNAVALILLAALPLWAVAQEAIRYYDFGYRPATRTGGFVRQYNGLAAATNSDTINGPIVPVQNARRVMFRLTARSANTCSLMTYYVTMKDTTEAALQTTSLWTDANGLPGLTIVDNVSNNNFSDSLGGRTAELIAPGSGRIPWLYARVAVRMKCCGNSKADSIRWFAHVQMD